MDLCTGSRNVLRTSILVLASLAISGLAWGQHGQESRGQGEHEGNAGRSGGQGHEGVPAVNRVPVARTRTSKELPRALGRAATRAGKPTANPGNRSESTRDNRGGNSPGYNRNNSGNRGGNPSANQGRNPSGNRGGYTANNRGGMNNRRAPGRTLTLRGGGSPAFGQTGRFALSTATECGFNTICAAVAPS